MQRRRQFLAAAGSAVAFGTGLTTGAEDEVVELSTGVVTEAFHEGWMGRDASEARRALEAIGLNPTVETVTEFQVGDADNGGPAAPRIHYGDPKRTDSELVVGLGNAPGQRTVFVTVAMLLDAPTDSWRYASYCPDVIGIVYDSTDWAAVGVPSLETTDRHGARFRPDTVGTNVLAGAVTVRNHVDGRNPSAPASERLPPSTVTLTGKFTTRTETRPSPIRGAYAPLGTDPRFTNRARIRGGR
ncbi:MAG: hypothetical protein ACOC0F_00300 [archaeon]